jgi:hypothetical protein
MHAAAERHPATKSWRQWAAELRQVARTTRDPQLRQRYLELADRWEEEASDEEPQPHRRRVG